MNSGKGIYVGGTLLSIVLSLALYFSGRRETAIFVGLWAPTIMNLGQSLLEEDEQPTTGAVLRKNFSAEPLALESAKFAQ
jgi:hypothetical protein